MTLSIPLTGLTASDVVPGTYVEVNFAQGAASSGALSYPVLLMGNKTSAGSATADTVIYGPDTATQCTSQTECDALFGPGSELSRMFAEFTAVNKDTPLYMIAVTESGGTAATGTLTIATAATANGSVRCYVGEEFAEASITSGDSVTTIATALVAAINAKTAWAVTAGNSAGVITLTAKIKGPRGNLIRFSGQIFGSSVGTTASPTAQTAMSSGATADSNTTALATIITRRFGYIVTAAHDATQVGALATQVTTQALPTTGFRQAAICGSVDTLANATTFATGINNARVECVWLQNSDRLPGELAARACAIYALNESTLTGKRSLNFDDYGTKDGENAFWNVKAPRAGTVPTRANIKSALENGITPISVALNGTTRIVKRITTRCLNGSVSDFRIRDAHKRVICDRFGDDLLVKGTLQLAGKSLGNDPLDGQKPPGPNVVTPRVGKALVNALLREYAANDLIQNVDQTIADAIVQRETASPTRLTARIPLQPIDILDQSGFVVDQL